MLPLSHPLRCGLLRGSNVHAAGGTRFSSGLLIQTPASWPSLPLRDGLRFTHVIASLPFPLLLGPARGAGGTP